MNGSDVFPADQFRLIDHGWLGEFEAAAKLKTDELLIVSPFLKTRAVKRLTHGQKKIRVLTRFSLHDFSEGVSDFAALKHLLDAGADVCGIKHLHAKLYVFGNQRGIVTSANLTEAALTRNHELGFVTSNSNLICSCREYFERLWFSAGKQVKPLTHELLKSWEAKVAAAGGRKASPGAGLGDFGADLGFMPDAPATTVEPTISTKAFVKFFGTGDGRANRSVPVLDEVGSSESHWSLSYPKGKRPRQPRTGDVMFIARLVHSPNDILVYGRAIAYRHEPGRDDASAADIKRTPWKKQWCHYIRVRDPEFIDGTLAGGISLNLMMNELGARAFASTAENEDQGKGNTKPRKALRSKAQMRLSPESANWLNAKFSKAIAEHGRIPTSKLEKLYWPELP